MVFGIRYFPPYSLLALLLARRLFIVWLFIAWRLARRFLKPMVFLVIARVDLSMAISSTNDSTYEPGDLVITTIDLWVRPKSLGQRYTDGDPYTVWDSRRINDGPHNYIPKGTVGTVVYCSRHSFFPVVSVTDLRFGNLSIWKKFIKPCAALELLARCSD